MADCPKFRIRSSLILLVFAHLASEIAAEDGTFLSVLLSLVFVLPFSLSSSQDLIT